MATQLSRLPTEFRAGTTVEYTRTLADYSAADSWGLVLHVNGASGFSITGTPSGSSFLVEILASKTATVSVADGATTAGSKTLTKAAGDFVAAGVRAGDLITGPGIPDGTYVDGDYPIGATSLTMSAAATAAGSSLAIKFRFPPGLYEWVERVTKAGKIYDVDWGKISILADPSGAPAGSFSTAEQRELEIIERVIADHLASGAPLAYSMGDRGKTFNKLSDLYDLKYKLEAIVEQQKAGSGFQVARGAFTGSV